MRRVLWPAGAVVVCAILLVLSRGAAADDRTAPNSGSWLGADPGYGMRSWGDFYPGLDLTPDQRRQLADIRADTRRRVCAARDDLRVEPAERMRRIGEARRIGSERELAVLTPEQREHLRRNPPAPSPLFRWQDRPPRAERAQTPRPPAPRNSAGLIPGVNDLSDEQTNRIAEIRGQTQRQVRALEADRTLKPQQRAACIEQIRREGHHRILAVLTDGQRAAFERHWRQRQSPATGRST